MQKTNSSDVFVWLKLLLFTLSDVKSTSRGSFSYHQFRKTSSQRREFHCPGKASLKWKTCKAKKTKAGVVLMWEIWRPTSTAASLEFLSPRVVWATMNREAQSCMYWRSFRFERVKEYILVGYRWAVLIISFIDFWHGLRRHSSRRSCSVWSWLGKVYQQILLTW